MGGPAGSGGSDQSDERKVDTYADQLKKEQARKSKFKRDKEDKIKKKNILDEYVDHSPTLQAVKNVGDKYSLNRRMKYANKAGINIQGMSTEEILSKDFKSRLDAKGYSDQPGNLGGDDNRGPDQIKSLEQPKVISQMNNTGIKSGMITADKMSPTSAEISDEYTALKTKRRGKKNTILTSVTGVEEDPTLGKKTLLG